MIRSARKRIDFKSATFCFQLFFADCLLQSEKKCSETDSTIASGPPFFTASSSGCEWYCLPVASQLHVDWRSVDVAILRQITFREDVFGNGFRAGVGAHLPAIGVPMVLHALLHAGHADGGPHLCVYVCVRVCAGFWVAMADQGQTPGRPLVTTSAGRGSNTFRGPSGSWPGSSPSRRRAPADWPYGNHTAGTSRLATRAAGLNDPLRQEGTWEAPIN